MVVHLRRRLPRARGRRSIGSSVLVAAVLLGCAAESDSQSVGGGAAPATGTWVLAESSPSVSLDSVGEHDVLLVGSSSDFISLQVSGCSSASFSYRQDSQGVERLERASTDGGCVLDVGGEYLACLGALTGITLTTGGQGEERLDLSGADCTLAFARAE